VPFSIFLNEFEHPRFIRHTGGFWQVSFREITREISANSLPE
jgi:hypothetical protein